MYNFTVEQGKTYLLRLVNGVMNDDMFFAIAGHNVTVVGQDAAYVKPVTTPFVMISPGQTMDLLLRADQSPAQPYYIVARPFYDSTPNFANFTTSAVLRYKLSGTNESSGTGRPPLFPVNLPNIRDRAAADGFTDRIRALATENYPINVPRNISERLFVTVSVNTIVCPDASCEGPRGNRLAASLNNVSFDIPSVDILQAYSR